MSQGRQPRPQLLGRGCRMFRLWQQGRRQSRKDAPAPAAWTWLEWEGERRLREPKGKLWGSFSGTGVPILTSGPPVTCATCPAGSSLSHSLCPDLFVLSSSHPQSYPGRMPSLPRPSVLRQAESPLGAGTRLCSSLLSHGRSPVKCRVLEMCFIGGQVYSLFKLLPSLPSHGTMRPAFPDSTDGASSVGWASDNVNLRDPAWYTALDIRAFRLERSRLAGSEHQAWSRQLSCYRIPVFQTSGPTLPPEQCMLEFFPSPWITT